MYARESVGRLIALVRAGLIDLEATAVTRFSLEAVNEAVAHAAAHAGAFEATVVCP
jgi:alcohol dehydrogenase